MLNIVLLEPEKPSNTGNIGRTCVLTNSRLHLVRPFSFRLDDKLLKRSGMDYWDKVDLVIHDDMDEFLEYIKEMIEFFMLKLLQQIIIMSLNIKMVIFSCSERNLQE